MRKVYICSPYRAKDGAELDRNIDYAQQLTRQALEAGLAPITPHLYMTQCMDDKKPEERAASDYAKLHECKHCYERRLCSLMGYENCCTANTCTAAYRRAYEYALSRIRERQET